MEKPGKALYGVIKQIQLKNGDKLNNGDPFSDCLLYIGREDYYQLVEIASNLPIELCE